MNTTCYSPSIPRTSNSTPEVPVQSGLPDGSPRIKIAYQTLNVRGLVLISNRNKVSLISDKLDIDNSIGISLTETWLNSDICDAELTIENYYSFRAYRESCIRGGTAIYLRSDLFFKSSKDTQIGLWYLC